MYETPGQDLLESKPEGEDRLLGLLVNKLGDPERKISSKVCYFLSFLSVYTVKFVIRAGLNEPINMKMPENQNKNQTLLGPNVLVEFRLF